MAQYKGASRQHEINSSRRRKDTRLAGQRFSDFFQSADGAVFGTFALPVLALVLIKVPFSGELLLLLAWAFKRKFVDVDHRTFDFPYRVPKLANVNDGSYKGKKKGEGVTSSVTIWKAKSRSTPATVTCAPTNWCWEPPARASRSPSMPRC